MTLWLAGALAATVFLTSTLSGIFGMAGGMMLLWVLLLVLPVGTAIAVQGIIQMVANGSRVWFTRRYVDWRILAMTVSGIGLAALILFIVRYQPSLLAVYFVVGLLPVLVWLPWSWLALDASRPPQALLCGLVAGSLNMTVGVSGPTIDIFFIRTGMDRRTVIATKAATQMVSHAAKTAFYAGAAFEVAAGDWLAVAIPIAVLGTRAGNLVLERMSDAGFRAWTRWIVTGVGLVYLSRGIALLV